MALQIIYQHALNPKNSQNILSIGINHYKPHTDCSTHAERSAIDKLPRLRNFKHLTKIDILVIRVSPTGFLRMSKPCSKCISDMSIYPQKKGYAISSIYYSDTDGEIVRTNLKKLIDCDGKHISRYYRTL